MKPLESIEIKDSIIIENILKDSHEPINDMREAKQALELFSQFKNVIGNAAYHQQIESLNDIKTSISKINETLERKNVPSEPEIREELVISKGFQVGGFGAQSVTTILLAKMPYSELQEVLEKVKGKTSRLSTLPARFIERIKGYLK